METSLVNASVLAATPPAWGDLRKRLTRLKDARPADAETIGRLIQMVEELEKAGSVASPDWLNALQAEFGLFFFDLDAKLLATTDQVIHTADVLDFHLKGYSQ
jgi:hypothetical protein